MQIAAPLNSEPVPELQWIEVATSLQIPSFQIIGLPAPEVAEARERIRAAIDASGYEFPRRRIVLNLSPASIRKRGTGMDLAMALAVLDSGSSRSEPSGAQWAAWGELGLQGEVKAAGQVTRTLYAAWRAGVPKLILPVEDWRIAVERARWIARAGELSGPEPGLIPVRTLREAWEAICGQPPKIELGPSSSAAMPSATDDHELELMPLTPSLERIIGLAAAGAHHLLLLGPRGTGKSHAIEWLTRLQPPMSDSMKVRHALLCELGLGEMGGHAGSVVRRVGVNARAAALVGGATPALIRPGEFTLADGGLLVADEFPEWSRDCREALREPLERGSVTLTRANARLELPARFVLAANGNLCPCGGWPAQFPLPMEAGKNREAAPRCKCALTSRTSYLARLSGPILDRLELVGMVATRLGNHPEVGDSRRSLEALRKKTEKARERSLRLWGAIPGKLSSSEAEGLLKSHRKWLEAMETTAPASLRARHKILKTALTICAWDDLSEPELPQFLEAACYRPERLGLCD